MAGYRGGFVIGLSSAPGVTHTSKEKGKGCVYGVGEHVRIRHESPLRVSTATPCCAAACRCAVQHLRLHAEHHAVPPMWTGSHRRCAGFVALAYTYFVERKQPLR